MGESEIYLKRLRIGIILALILLIVSIVFSVFLFITFRRRKHYEVEDIEMEVFKYMRFNPSSNEISRGFTSLRGDILGEKNFLSYDTGEGTQVLISKMEDNEYRCHGTCICETEDDNYENNRRGVSTISRSVVSLVAATSSLLAMNIARGYFANMCTQVFDQPQDNCGAVHFMSETDTCKMEIGWEEMAEKTTYRPYMCQGNCYPNINLSYLPSRYMDAITSVRLRPIDIESFKKKSDKHGCKKLVLHEEVEGWSEKEAKEKFYFALRMFCIDNSYVDWPTHACESCWDLEDYCLDEPICNYEKKQTWGDEECENCEYFTREGKGKTKLPQQFPMCGAFWDGKVRKKKGTGFDDGDGRINPSIVCRDIVNEKFTPKPKEITWDD